jgi:hypothetical protein
MKYAAHSFGGNRFDSAEPLVISQLATPSAPLVLLTSRGDQSIKVLMRMLSYYEIRLRTVCPNGAPTKMKAVQHAAAAHRRMQ